MKAGHRTIACPNGLQISPKSEQVLAIFSDTFASGPNGVLVSLSFTASSAPIKPFDLASPMFGFLANSARPASNFGVNSPTFSIKPSFKMTLIAFKAIAHPTGCPEAVKPWGNSSTLSAAACILSDKFGPRITAPIGK